MGNEDSAQSRKSDVDPSVGKSDAGTSAGPNVAPNVGPSRREPPVIDAKPITMDEVAPGRGAEIASKIAPRNGATFVYVFLAGVILASLIAWAGQQFGVGNIQIVDLRKQLVHQNELIIQQGEQLAVLSQQLQNIQAHPSDIGPQIAVLTKRLDNVEAQTQSVKQTVNELTQKIPTDFDMVSFRQSLDTLNAAGVEIAHQQSLDKDNFSKIQLTVEGLIPLFSTLDLGIKELKTNVSTQNLQLSSLSSAQLSSKSQIESTNARIDTILSSPSLSSIATAAQALNLAILNDTSPEASLIALDGLMVHDPTYTKLRDLLAKGIVTQKAIQQTYSDLRPALIKELSVSESTEGGLAGGSVPNAQETKGTRWYEGIFSNATRLVEVKPITSVHSANDLLLQEISNAILAGDLRKAQNILVSLPEKARALAAPLSSDIDRRVSALDASRDFYNTSLVRLGEVK